MGAAADSDEEAMGEEEGSAEEDSAAEGRTPNYYRSGFRTENADSWREKKTSFIAYQWI